MMVQRNLAHNRQTQTTTRCLGIIDTVEALEHQFGLRFGQPHPGILDFQHRPALRVFDNGAFLRSGHVRCFAHIHDTHMNLPRLSHRARGIADGVIDQVAHHFPQQEGVAKDRHAARRGLEIQLQMFLCGRQHPLFGHFADQRRQIHARFTLRIAYTVVTAPENPRQWVLVEVGESLEKRNQLINQIVASVILPQFFIVPVVVVLVWFGLAQGLRPLQFLQSRIASRDEHDLSPMTVRRLPEEIQPLVEAFNDLLDRMRDNLEVQQRFIADAAHQLKTPLTALKTQAQLAMYEEDAVALRGSLQRIGSSVDRASHLVSQLPDTDAPSAPAEPAAEGPAAPAETPAPTSPASPSA